MKLKIAKTNRAFTLVELLVTITIIGFLVAITTVGLNSVRSKSRDTRRISDVRQMVSALDLYHSDYNSYPAYLTPNMSLVGANGQTYIKKIPAAPTNLDGGCLVNSYDYSLENDQHYVINYCLGGQVSDLTAGSCSAVPGNICRRYAWSPLGSGNGEINSSQVNYFNLAFSPSGELYSSYQSDGCGINNKETLIKYVNGAWSPVQSCFSPNTTMMEAEMAIDSNGTPFLAFYTGYNTQAYLMNWDNINSYFVISATTRTTGTSSIDTNNSGLSYYTNIAINPATNEPYIVYKDGMVTNHPVVWKYNGSAMIKVGDPATNYPAACNNANYYDIVFNPVTNEPYVSWAGGAGAKKPGVMRFDGANWVTVGDGTIEEAGTSLSCEMAFDPITNDLYLACSGNTSVTTPKVVKWSGSLWSQVGQDIIVTANLAKYMRLAFKPGTSVPYVAYADSTNSNRPTVKKLSSNQWVNVGTGVISASAADYMTMSFHPTDGTLMVGYKDTTSSNRATVYQIPTN